MKKKTEKAQKNAQEEVKKKRSLGDLFQHTWFIITALVIAVILVSAIVIGIVMSATGLTLGEVFGIKVKRIDYANDPLDKYISIDSDDYKNLEMDIAIREPDEKDVLDKKIQALAAAAKKAGYDKGGEFQKNEPIGAGDKIYFYYAAYVLDQEGNRVEIKGLNNCKDSGDGNAAVYVVGSGDFSFLSIAGDLGTSEYEYKNEFIHHFDGELINEVPKEYQFFSFGEIKETDIVYATVTYIDHDGLLYDDVNIRINLSDDSCESMWGEGIRAYITDLSIGFANTNPETFVRTESNRKITFTSFNVDYIVRGEENPTTIETVFPYDYSDESLRNKTVYFDLFIDKTVCYKTPEFNDDFVLNTLKLTEKRLEKYDGNNLTQKCEAYYRDMLNREYEYNKQVLAESYLYDKIKENVQINKMPEREIEYEYDDYVFYYEWACELANKNSGGNASLDDYIVTALGLEDGADWSAYLWDFIENAVFEKLIFYSILRNEGFIENTEAFESFCEDELQKSYTVEYGKTIEDFETPEKYRAEIQAYREQKIFDCGSEDAFIDEMYYRYAGKIIVENAKLNDVVNKH